MTGSAIPAGVIAEAVAAARGYLRMDDDSEADLLARLAGTAIALGEAFCGTAFVVRAHEDVVAGGAWRRLAAAPVSAIQGVTAVPVDGATPMVSEVLPVGAYGIDIDGEGVGWVRVEAAGARFAVAYVAGLAASWDALPAPLAQGVVTLIAHLFADRTSEGVPPAAVVALWRPFRRLRLETRARA